MRILLFSLVCFCTTVITNNLLAQELAIPNKDIDEVKPTKGYLILMPYAGIPIGGDRIGADQKTTPNSDVAKVKIGSYGSGFGLEIGGGYQFHDWLSLEVVINGQVGYRKEFNFEELENNTKNEEEQKIRLFQLKLGAGLRAQIPGKRVAPFFSIGIYQPLTQMLKVKFMFVEDDLNGTEIVQKTTLHVKGNYMPGFYAGGGISFMISAHARFTLAVRYCAMNFIERSGKVTESEGLLIRNGVVVQTVDLLPRMTTQEKEIEFVKEVDLLNDNNNPDQPQKILRSTHPANNLSLNIGFDILF